MAYNTFTGILERCTDGTCGNCNECRPELVEQAYSDEFNKIQASNDRTVQEIDEIKKDLGVIEKTIQFLRHF